MLSPLNAEIGIKTTCLVPYPTLSRQPETSLLTSSNLLWLYGGSVESILLTTQTICLTPKVLASKACSFVCPAIPSSNSFVGAATTKIAQSACKPPVIMFYTKPFRPTLSKTATSRALDLNLTTFECSLPPSRNFSTTHAYFSSSGVPSSAASFSSFSLVPLGMPPHAYTRWPAVDDFPDCWWPRTQMLTSCFFSGIFAVFFKLMLSYTFILF